MGFCQNGNSNIPACASVLFSATEWCYVISGKLRHSHFTVTSVLIGTALYYCRLPRRHPLTTNVPNAAAVSAHGIHWNAMSSRSICGWKIMLARCASAAFVRPLCATSTCWATTRSMWKPAPCVARRMPLWASCSIIWVRCIVYIQGCIQWILHQMKPLDLWTKILTDWILENRRHENIYIWRWWERKWRTSVFQYPMTCMITKKIG